MKNIVLVGFMGTGKTAAAKALAKKLGRKYVSLDKLIEHREKRPITRIFRESGEPYFRKVESEAAALACAGEGIVVDAGGGVVLAEENWAHMRKNGIVICLTAAPEAILKRVRRHTRRPLLNVEDPRGKIDELLKARAPFYAKADFAVDTSDLNIEQVVEKITEIVKFDD